MAKKQNDDTAAKAIAAARKKMQSNSDDRVQDGIDAFADVASDEDWSELLAEFDYAADYRYGNEHGLDPIFLSPRRMTHRWMLRLLALAPDRVAAVRELRERWDEASVDPDETGLLADLPNLRSVTIIGPNKAHNQRDPFVSLADESILARGLDTLRLQNVSLTERPRIRARQLVIIGLDGDPDMTDAECEELDVTATSIPTGWVHPQVVHARRFENGAGLATATNARSLSVSGFTRGLDGLDALGANLEELEIHWSHDLTKIPDLSGLTGLRRLLLNNSRKLTSAAGLGPFPALEQAQISGCALLTDLGEISASTRLRRLLVPHCPELAPDALDFVYDLEDLEELDVRGTPVDLDLDRLAKLPALRFVSLFASATRPDALPDELIGRVSWGQYPERELIGGADFRCTYAD